MNTRQFYLLMMVSGHCFIAINASGSSIQGVPQGVASTNTVTAATTSAQSSGSLDVTKMGQDINDLKRRADESDQKIVRLTSSTQDLKDTSDQLKVQISAVASQQTSGATSSALAGVVPTVSASPQVIAPQTVPQQASAIQAVPPAQAVAQPVAALNQPIPVAANQAASVTTIQTSSTLPKSAVVNYPAAGSYPYPPPINYPYPLPGYGAQGYPSPQPGYPYAYPPQGNYPYPPPGYGAPSIHQNYPGYPQGGYYPQAQDVPQIANVPSAPNSAQNQIITPPAVAPAPVSANAALLSENGTVHLQQSLNQRAQMQNAAVVAQQPAVPVGPQQVVIVAQTPAPETAQHQQVLSAAPSQAQVAAPQPQQVVSAAPSQSQVVVAQPQVAPALAAPVGTPAQVQTVPATASSVQALATMLAPQQTVPAASPAMPASLAAPTTTPAASTTATAAASILSGFFG